MVEKFNMDLENTRTCGNSICLLHIKELAFHWLSGGTERHFSRQKTTGEQVCLYGIAISQACVLLIGKQNYSFADFFVV